MPRVQILVVNEKRDVPTKAGGTFPVQDAETVILDDAGQPLIVGPLGIPRDLLEKVTPGMYDGVFKWERNYKTGRLEYVLAALTAVGKAPVSRAPSTPASAT